MNLLNNYFKTAFKVLRFSEHTSACAQIPKSTANCLWLSFSWYVMISIYLRYLKKHFYELHKLLVWFPPSQWSNRASSSRPHTLNSRNGHLKGFNAGIRRPDTTHANEASNSVWHPSNEKHIWETRRGRRNEQRNAFDSNWQLTFLPRFLRKPLRVKNQSNIEAVHCKHAYKRKSLLWTGAPWENHLFNLTEPRRFSLPQTYTACVWLKIFFKDKVVLFRDSNA